MAKPTFKQHRRCLDFAHLVSALARGAPDEVTKHELFSVVDSIRRRFGSSHEDKQREIAITIIDGASTVSEIIEETYFHQDDVHAITKQFEQQKLVEFRRTSSGDRGRPKICIFPTPALIELFPPKN